MAGRAVCHLRIRLAKLKQKKFLRKIYWPDLTLCQTIYFIIIDSGNGNGTTTTTIMSTTSDSTSVNIVMMAALRLLQQHFSTLSEKENHRIHNNLQWLRGRNVQLRNKIKQKFTNYYFIHSTVKSVNGTRVNVLKLNRTSEKKIFMQELRNSVEPRLRSSLTSCSINSFETATALDEIA